jgi:CubicO group peptidase (beta-lactamase class C family)
MTSHPHLPQLHRCIQTYLTQHTFSAASCIASTGGHIFHQAVYGHVQQDRFSPPTQDNTFFDLASLSKPLGAGLAALYLVGKGRLDLNARLSDTLPVLQKPTFENITLGMLLDHTAGFAALPGIYAFLSSQHPTLLGTDKAIPAAQEWLAQQPLAYAPGTQCIYSDVGFLWLGWIIEHTVKKPLDVFLESTVYKPLNIHKELFFIRNPTHTHPAHMFAATEECPLRKRLIQGEVHDPSTWSIGGVGGPAGLFGTARAVWVLMQKLLLCHKGLDFFFHPATVTRFWTRSRRPPHTTRTLCWDTPSAEHSTASKRYSKTSVGHLGFTGTSIWLDLRTDVLGIVLTNAVHPTVEGKKEAMAQFRPRAYEIIASEGERLMNT